MQTLKFKSQPKNSLFATNNQMFSCSPQRPAMLSKLSAAILFDYYALGSSRKLERTAEHLIEGSKKRICRLRFEFYISHVIEKRSNVFTLITGLVRDCCQCFVFKYTHLLTVQ